MNHVYINLISFIKMYTLQQKTLDYENILFTKINLANSLLLFYEKLKYSVISILFASLF